MAPAAATCSRRTARTVLLDCGNGVFSKLRRFRDYTKVDAVVISHLHADHFLDLVPFSYALTYAPRQQPTPVDRWPGTDAPARPKLYAPRGATECFRRVVGAWGNEDLIENAFDLSEFSPDDVIEIGSMRFTLPGRAALHGDLRDRHRLDERRRPHHLRRRLLPERAAGRVCARHRPADRRGDAAAARAHRHPRSPHAAEAARARHAARTSRGAAHARVRRARRAVGAPAAPARPFCQGPIVRSPREGAVYETTAYAPTSRSPPVPVGGTRASGPQHRPSPDARLARRPATHGAAETPDSPTSSACAARSTSCSATSGTGRACPRSRRAFSPRVDVYYCGDPPKAVIKADLAGVGLDDVNLEVRGRALVIIGRAPAARHRGPRLPADRDRARARSRARSSSAPTSSPSRRAPPTRTASCASSCRSPSAARRRQVPISAASERGRPRSSLVIEVIQSPGRALGDDGQRRRRPSRTRCRCCR